MFTKKYALATFHFQILEEKLKLGLVLICEYIFANPYVLRPGVFDQKQFNARSSLLNLMLFNLSFY